MSGLLIIITSFVLAVVVRTIAIKKDECMMAKFLPQLIMIVGGIYGGYLFVIENWKL